MNIASKEACGENALIYIVRYLCISSSSTCTLSAKILARTYMYLSLTFADLLQSSHACMYYVHVCVVFY